VVTVIALVILGFVLIAVVGGALVRWMAPEPPVQREQTMTRLRREQIDRLIREGKVDD